MSGPSNDTSKSISGQQSEPTLRLDIQWLCGQKKTPDRLPTRDEYQQQRSTAQSPRRKSRLFVNILASFLVLGAICGSTYGLYRSGWLPFENSNTPMANDNSKLTPEEQRQADETIDAILALQEMAAKSESNTPTKKR
ncbi:MAG: hypothetical protein ACK480_16160 [Planctomycetota bacterium]|jgi:hypothetical protein|nr:hypothetical protein [Planctomycetaceae bacterium]